MPLFRIVGIFEIDRQWDGCEFKGGVYECQTRAERSDGRSYIGLQMQGQL